MNFQSNLDDSAWACKVCTYSNLPTHLACEICATERPQTRPIPLRRDLSNEGKALFASGQSLGRQSEPEIRSSTFQPGVGDVVHALYWEDGKYHPAEIVKIDDQTGAVRVQYIGFGNYEWVGKDEIGPGFGDELSEKALVRGQQHVLEGYDDSLDVQANGKGGGGGSRGGGGGGGGGGGRGRGSGVVRVPIATR